MIISASRRTDIPAFYAEWFLNRVRAGFCEVRNPFHRGQVSRVSLRPEDVDAIVFWTRNPAPLFPYLDELDRHGLRTLFLCTLMDNPRELDPGAAGASVAIDAFRRLSRRVGPTRVAWRYDPIVFSSLTPPAFHAAAFERLADALDGDCRRCIVSLLDFYPRVKRRFAQIAGVEYHAATPERLDACLPAIVAAAHRHGMAVCSCAEDIPLPRYGILPGRCIDPAQIREAFGIEVPDRKDPAQRKLCGCAVSRDIGAYDTCPCGCLYCYATQHPDRAQANYRRHDPLAAALAPGEPGGAAEQAHDAPVVSPS